jgi:outer membrane murein-binding lipoprotein Lpp
MFLSAPSQGGGSKEAMKMFQVKSRFASLLAGAVVLGGLSLSGCATEDYVNKKIDEVNAHVSAVEQKADSAGQRADAAMAAAQAAQSSANSAASAAQQANSRIDALTGRVDTIEQKLAAKQPRN